ERRFVPCSAVFLPGIIRNTGDNVRQKARTAEWQRCGLGKSRLSFCRNLAVSAHGRKAGAQLADGSAVHGAGVGVNWGIVVSAGEDNGCWGSAGGKAGGEVGVVA